MDKYYRLVIRYFADRIYNKELNKYTQKTGSDYSGTSGIILARLPSFLTAISS